MNFIDRIRAMLGIGCRRVRPKLGLSEDRRQGPQNRRDPLRSSGEAAAELDRLAHDKWKGDAK